METRKTLFFFLNGYFERVVWVLLFQTGTLFSKRVPLTLCFASV